MTRNDIIDVLKMAGALVFIVVIAILMALFGSGG
jgi:hypothetical protein